MCTGERGRSVGQQTLWNNQVAVRVLPETAEQTQKSLEPRRLVLCFVYSVRGRCCCLCCRSFEVRLLPRLSGEATGESL